MGTSPSLRGKVCPKEVTDTRGYFVRDYVPSEKHQKGQHIVVAPNWVKDGPKNLRAIWSHFWESNFLKETSITFMEQEHQNFTPETIEFALLKTKPNGQ